MDETSTGTVTTLLRRWRAGDGQARDQLFAAIYEDLRRIARRQMAAERPGHTLQPTGLVHEAYERLLGAEVDWQDRQHFTAVVAQVMRRLLVDQARARRSDKRGGDAPQISLDDVTNVPGREASGILDLDSALKRLGERDARKEKVLELHYFGGLTHPQIAEALDISPATVDRDLRMARAWIREALDEA